MHSIFQYRIIIELKPSFSSYFKKETMLKDK